MYDDPSLDYRDLLARLADVVYAVDSDGRFTYVNPAGERIFGWPGSELNGEHFAKVIDPDALPETVEHFRRGLVSGDPSRYFETRIRQPDWSRCSTTSTPVTCPHAFAQYSPIVPVPQ